MESLRRLRGRQEWQFFAALPRAAPGLAWAWWALLLLRGVLPAAFGVALGRLVGAVQAGADLTGPLAAAGTAFVLMQVLPPIQRAVSADLGDRAAAWLFDRLTAACVGPKGMGHLEDPKLTGDLTVARDFDLGMTGPPLSFSVEFIADGLLQVVAGLAAAAVLAFYQPLPAVLLAGAWIATHWLLRESAIWRDRNTEEVRAAQRDAEYAYRLAVDPPAAKELRLFGLGGWTIERFVARRTRLHELQYAATRLRQRPLLGSLLLVGGANVVAFWWLATAGLDLGTLVICAQSALGISAIAFGGLSWALDGAAAPVAAALRLEAPMATAGALGAQGGQGGARGIGRPSRPPRWPARAWNALARARRSAPRSAGRVLSLAGDVAGSPAPPAISFNNLSFSYPNGPPILDHLDLTIPAGSSLAIVGQNGAGKTTLAKLLCRLYDPCAGGIEVDGVDLRDLDVDAWRARVTAVFQDFIRFELPLRDNVAPGGAPDQAICAALTAAGAANLAGLDTVLARGYAGGTDLSGGQWQRVALARALCAVELGAGVVLLDEPTAQLDVRGEAAIFERLLAATRGCTTILISHRFSTVRHADRICVLERGRVVELGTHDELIALGGRYRTMFDLQAQRFEAVADEEGVAYDVLA